MKDETLLSDEVIESLEMLTSRNYFREWIKNPTGYVAGSIAVRDLVNVVLFADACRASIQSGNSAQPVTVPAGYVLVPVEPTITILDEIDAIFDFGAEDSKDAWHRLLSAVPKIPDAPKAKNVISHYQGADGKEQDIITLAAKNGDSKCWCRTCRQVTLTDTRFVVCPDCGNKRCPKANDHRNACTGSNEPGQPGSAYPDAPKGV